MKTVLVTRPQPGATRTSERLLCGGFLPLVLPLTRIVALDATNPKVKFCAVAVTSASALREASDALLRPLLKVPCFAVGEATASAARARGFETVTTGDGDGASLAQTVIEELPTGGCVLYLTGKVRSPDFEQTLRKSGIHFRCILTYDTVSVSYTTDFLLDFFAQKRIDCCLLYSRWGAEEFLHLASRPELTHHFDNTSIFCLSRRIADALSHWKQGEVHVSERPDEDALVQLMRET
ncbi:MAG: uroporphyrinogen-III synthase [Phyllobacterium sp.]|uniref:uroporphyrinogen-III synthase n=1 Tax=Phyllobacterium sp. TaxID=1871046 RepID=UPI0030F1A5B4